MPNLGAGVEQHVNPAVTPTWIFTPTPNAPSTVRLYNEGRYPVYVGGAGMDQVACIAIPPGSRPVELQNVTQTLYATSGAQVGAVGGTTSTAVTAGTTVITLAAAPPASFAAGSTIIIGSTANTGWEVQLVNSTTASSQLTFANPVVNDHISSSPVYAATAQLAQLRVSAGVI